MSRALTHLIIALVALAIAATIYASAYAYVTHVASRAAAVAGQIDAAADAAARANKTREALASLGEREAAINGHFIITNDIPLFLAELETLGASFGAKTEVVSVGDKPSADSRIAVAVRITGSYDAVVRTIGAIEYGSRDIRMENLVLDTPVPGDPWTAAASLSVGTATSTPAK